MTRHQEAMLSVAKGKDMPDLMLGYGFEFVGPTDKDVFLFREPDGRCWTLSGFRGRVAPMRQLFNSLWTADNVASILAKTGFLNG